MFLVQKKRSERKRERRREAKKKKGQCVKVSRVETHGRCSSLSLSVGDDTAPAAAEEEEAEEEEEATSLLVVVAEDINYVGVTLLKNIIGEKRKREGRLHCTAPFSSPSPPSFAGLARLLPLFLLSRLFGHIFSRLLSLKYVPHKRALHFSLKCGNL